MNSVCNFAVSAASTIAACLTAFFTINLHNMLKTRKNADTAYAEVERPGEFAVLLAAFGTVLFFAESFLYVILVFGGRLEVFNAYFLMLSFPCMSCVRGVGLAVMVFGYFLFLWSAVARGRYATSWEMPRNHRLVTWGPYRYVRHPSYTGYFLMFAGLALTWLNLVAFVPLLAVPGYVKLTSVEEELLIKRFGEEYERYQRRTGKFFPKMLNKN